MWNSSALIDINTIICNEVISTSKFVGATLPEKTYTDLENLKEKGNWISTADLLRDVIKEGVEVVKNKEAE